MGMGRRSIPTASLYGAAIAVVSGGYSILASTGGTGMTTGAWIMLLVGVVALVHGIVLLTPVAGRLGTWSGPLMIAYAVVMLVNRAVLPMGSGGMMGSGMGGSAGSGGMGSGGMGGGMGFGGMMDGYLGTMGPAGGPGMVALALLMLASGLIMTVRSDGGM